MTLDQLKTRVKIKVDEYTPAGVSHSFDDYLEPMLNESADELADKAPKWLLNATDIVLTGIKYADDLAFIPLPAEFARLYDMKFPLWDRPVFDVISPEHPDYELQQNTYTKAGYGRPVVMIQSWIPAGGTLGKHLVCGKVADGALPAYARCIVYTTPALMPDVLDEALTWLTASKVLQILEYKDQAKLAYDLHLDELKHKVK